MIDKSNRDLEDYFTILMLTAGSDSQVEELRALWDRFLNSTKNAIRVIEDLFTIAMLKAKDDAEIARLQLAFDNLIGKIICQSERV